MFRQHPRRAFFEKIENLAGIRQKLSLVRITTSWECQTYLQSESHSTSYRTRDKPLLLTDGAVTD